MEDFVSDLPVFEAQTAGVRVRSQSYFLAGQSNPEDEDYVWAYRIEIANDRDFPVQLLSRHWIITDATGIEEEVKGDGVTGEQPVIAPGDSHAYLSGTPLGTPTGFMRGSYQMVDHQGLPFEVEIPAFSLDSPYFRGQVN